MRGKRGAAWQVRVKEAGEQNGRLHGHAASDFEFIDHPWLSDAALRCGLGFVQYSRKKNRELERRARAAGPGMRAGSIAAYLMAGYLGKGDAPDKVSPWPRHTRLVNAARGVLPPEEPAKDCRISFRSVSEIAVDFLGARWVEADATSFSSTAAVPGQVGEPQNGLERFWG